MIVSFYRFKTPTVGHMTRHSSTWQDAIKYASFIDKPANPCILFY